MARKTKKERLLDALDFVDCKFMAMLDCCGEISDIYGYEDFETPSYEDISEALTVAVKLIKKNYK